MATCHDCDGYLWMLEGAIGNGECSKCKGTGEVFDYAKQRVDGFSDNQSDCLECDGTGVCQTCDGSGEVDDDDDD